MAHNSQLVYIFSQKHSSELWKMQLDHREITNSHRWQARKTGLTNHNNEVILWVQFKKTHIEICLII